MRKLNKQEITDILYGCTVLGTGGGGNLNRGLYMINKDIEEGRELYLADLDELSDDSYIATPYGCGAPAAEGSEEEDRFHTLPHLDDSPAVLAFKSLEKYLARKFFAVSSTELGGENTAEALHIAFQLGLPIMDADPAGRSVPELQHSSYFVKGVPIDPLAVATNFGESIILEKVCNDFRAEEIVRSIAVSSGDDVGVADHPMTGKAYKESVIPGAISYALKIGKILRECKADGDEAASKIAEACSGKVLFRGVLTSAPWKTEGGFNVGEINLTGAREFEGEEYKILFKNENMVSYRGGKLDASIPDLICMIDEGGNPLTTPNFNDGMKINVLGLPSPEVWTTERGLEVFGPRAMGYDFEYVPFK